MTLAWRIATERAKKLGWIGVRMPIPTEIPLPFSRER